VQGICQKFCVSTVKIVVYVPTMFKLTAIIPAILFDLSFILFTT